MFGAVSTACYITQVKLLVNPACWLCCVSLKNAPCMFLTLSCCCLQGAANKRKLQETEDEILRVLSSSSGNILEDEAAVRILASSKLLADEISAKQKIADETEAKIDEARAGGSAVCRRGGCLSGWPGPLTSWCCFSAVSTLRGACCLFVTLPCHPLLPSPPTPSGYKPVAHHSSLLYFCVAELASLDPMYQYSLRFFIDLFVRAIADTPACPDLSTRLVALNQQFTFFLFQNVCRCVPGCAAGRGNSMNSCYMNPNWPYPGNKGFTLCPGTSPDNRGSPRCALLCPGCRSLFEKDKLLFAMMLATKLKLDTGAITPQELRFFKTGGSPPQLLESKMMRISGWSAATRNWPDLFKASHGSWTITIGSACAPALAPGLCDQPSSPTSSTHHTGQTSHSLARRPTADHLCRQCTYRWCGHG